MSELISDSHLPNELYQATYSLMLYPDDPHFSLPHNELLHALAAINLLGEAQIPQRYLVGESFLSLFCFMGCSPHIELFPQENTQQAYCYIEIPKPAATTRCIISKDVKTPRCPQCKIDLSAWVSQLQQQCINTSCCPECDNTLIPHKLNWRKSAFFAKQHIIIGNIYEAEALPEQQLLSHLENTTHIAWKYAYIRSE